MIGHLACILAKFICPVIKESLVCNRSAEADGDTWMSVVCKEGRGGKGRVRRGIVHIHREKRDARVSRSEKKCSGVTGKCKLASMRY